MCCGVSYKFSNRLDQSILVITKNSFMHAQINSNTQNISFIFSWNMSGELLTNLGRCLYRYFTHARIIIHRLINGWIDLLIESIDLLIRGRIYFYGLMDLLFHIWIYWWMDGFIDGCIDLLMDVLIYWCMYGYIAGCIDLLMDGWISWWTDGFINVWVDLLMYRWIYWLVDGIIDAGWIYLFMELFIDGWIYLLMGGWIYWRMDGLI